MKQALANRELAGQDCNDRKFKTRTELARCLNSADEKFVLPLERHGDLLRVRMAKRLVLAERVDKRQISEAEAELEFAQASSEIVGASNTRANAERALSAQESTARAANSPTTCSRFGSTVTCY